MTQILLSAQIPAEGTLYIISCWIGPTTSRGNGGCQTCHAADVDWRTQLIGGMGRFYLPSPIPHMLEGLCEDAKLTMLLALIGELYCLKDLLLPISDVPDGLCEDAKLTMLQVLENSTDWGICHCRILTCRGPVRRCPQIAWRGTGVRV